MNYKKFIKSRNLRLKIMKLLNFLPDEMVVSLQYRIKTNRKLNLLVPKRYTEKLQWYKLYYKDPLMGECVDKYEVRNYVMKLGYANILIPLLGVYDSVEDINFDILPNSFVIKDTLGGGGNSVIIVKNKFEENYDKIKKHIKRWIKKSQGKHPGREWVYEGKKNRIVIEKYLVANESEGGLIDYKFFCFNGKVEYIYGIADRTLGQAVGLGIFDSNFNLLPYKRVDENPLTRTIKKPKNYELMVKCAEDLSKNFPHARIDLYNQNGEIYFGEITFFDGSGYMCFDPDEFDYIMGEKFLLPIKNKEK
jgi:hypothetical protein